jgi:hypothetical protein
MSSTGILFLRGSNKVTKVSKIAKSYELKKYNLAKRAKQTTEIVLQHKFRYSEV